MSLLEVTDRLIVFVWDIVLVIWIVAGESMYLGSFSPSEPAGLDEQTATEGDERICVRHAESDLRVLAKR